MKSPTNRKYQAKLGVVIVHYGDLQETYELLDSLNSQSLKRWKAFIVDNDPRFRLDVKKLKNLNYDYEYIKLTKNLGWAGGANKGAKVAISKNFDIVTFMTSDLVVLGNDFLEKLIAPIVERKAKVTLPLTVYLDSPEFIWMASAQINYWLLFTYDPHMNKNKNSITTYIQPMYGGKGLTFESKLLQEIDYWDTSYFLFFEDVDICHKAMKKSSSVMLVPDAIVAHNVSTYKFNRSSVKMEQLSAYHASKSAFVFMQKHLQGVKIITAFISQYIFRLPIFIASMMMQTNYKAIIAYINGIIDGTLLLLGIDREQYHEKNQT